MAIFNSYVGLPEAISSTGFVEFSQSDLLNGEGLSILRQTH